MSDLTVVLYDPPIKLMDALRDHSTYITSSYGNAVEQRDAAHRREAATSAELQNITTRYLAALSREAELRSRLAAEEQDSSVGMVEGAKDE